MAVHTTPAKRGYTPITNFVAFMPVKLVLTFITPVQNLTVITQRHRLYNSRSYGESSAICPYLRRTHFFILLEIDLNFISSQGRHEVLLYYGHK